jgi:hypothetical protein
VGFEGMMPVVATEEIMGLTDTVESWDQFEYCGGYEKKCPYHLPIREMITENMEYHRKYMEARR